MDNGIEDELLRGFKTLTPAPPDEFDSWMCRNDFTTEIGFGTYDSGRVPAFLYLKTPFLADSLQEAEDKLSIVRAMTVKGVLIPSTCWGFINHGDGYRLFAVMRELEVSKRGNPIANQQVGDELFMHEAIRWTSDEFYQGLESQWISCLGGEESLTSLLNRKEASYACNWGLDPQTNRYFPIDVEVIDVWSPGKKAIVDDWCARR